VGSGRSSRPEGAQVFAEGASLEELEPQGVVRVFALDARGPAIRLRAEAAGAEAAEARVDVGPPGAGVAIAATPAAPVKGLDREVALQIAVLQADGSPDPQAPPPVLRANVGEVVGLVPKGGGRFAASLLLPKQRHPEVAIVVAFAPWPHADSSEGALGAAIIPLSSSVALPGQTEPDVAIAVEIAGRTFGPVRSDDNGRFEVPVIVPPGHRLGASRATDRAGNSREKQVDLHLPATDQIACVANPSSLPADGSARAKVLCVATDRFGAPVTNPSIHAHARSGRLSGPTAASVGLTWEYVAPSSLDGRPDELLFDFPSGGPHSKERLVLKLSALALSSAELKVAPQPVFAGGSSAVALTPRDALGRRAGARPHLAAERGRLSALEPGPDGSFRATYQAPLDAGDWVDRLSGSVLPAAGSVAARIDLSLLGLGASRSALAARATALDGAPVEGLSLALGEAHAATGPDGVARFALPSSLRARLSELEVWAVDRPSLRAFGWLLPSADGVALFPEAGPFAPLRLDVPIALAPATPMDIRIEVERSGSPAVRVRALGARGEVVRDRELELELVRPGGRPIAHGPAQPQPDGSVLFGVLEPVGGTATATAVDVASGVSASREARLP